MEYTYDDLYRLTSETITEGEKVTTYTYAYDNVSNRILKTENGKETAYVYNSFNQLVSDSDNSYEYDLNGNLVRVIGASHSALYEYNCENKLVKATVQQGNNVVEESYTYDYAGNRTSKTTRTNGHVEFVKYLNDTNSELTNVLCEFDENGTEKCVYTIGADLISQERDGKVSVYLYDGHGSVVGLALMNGKVTDTYTYDAFGNLIKSTGRTANNYLYCGEQFDETTGLYYLRARYMDTSTGRFISQDSYAGSISDPISLHKYLYANSNPVMYSDPSGFTPLSLTDMSVSQAVNAQLEKISLSIMRLGMDIIHSLKATVAAIGTKRIIAVALIAVALYVGGKLSSYYCDATIDINLKEVEKNTKSIIIARAINVILSSFLQHAQNWARSKNKTNKDYDNKKARHHIVPRNLEDVLISQIILSSVGIDCYTFSELSPNIVLIKYSTHYAIHSNNTLYCSTVNSVICTAYFEAYTYGYDEQVIAVHGALLTFKGIIKGLDCVIP